MSKCGQQIPSLQLNRLCGHSCGCLSIWAARGWTCPEKPPDDDSSCGYPCRCQQVWLKSGWICWNKIKAEFCSVSEGDASTAAYYIQVVGLSGETLLCIPGTTNFRTSDIQAALEELCFKDETRFAMGGHLLQENVLYNAQTLCVESGTTSMQAVRCSKPEESKPVRTNWDPLKYREVKVLWCNGCRRHPVSNIVNTTPRCPSCSQKWDMPIDPRDYRLADLRVWRGLIASQLQS